MVKKQNNTIIWVIVAIAFLYVAGNQGFLGAVAPVDMIDVVFVVDTSGSMYGSKINATKIGIKNYIDSIGSKDVRVGLVTFSTDARRQIGLTTSHSDVKTLVGRMSAGGRTHLGDGIKIGRETISAGARAGAKKVIVLISDGAPNYYNRAGQSYECVDADGSVILIPTVDNDCTNYVRTEVNYAKQAGISIYTIGMGINPDTFTGQLLNDISTSDFVSMQISEISATRVYNAINSFLPIGTACTVTSWAPDTNSVCQGTEFTQIATPSCGGTRTVQGTKDCADSFVCLGRETRYNDICSTYTEAQCSSSERCFVGGTNCGIKIGYGYEPGLGCIEIFGCQGESADYSTEVQCQNDNGPVTCGYPPSFELSVKDKFTGLDVEAQAIYTINDGQIKTYANPPISAEIGDIVGMGIYGDGYHIVYQNYVVDSCGVNTFSFNDLVKRGEFNIECFNHENNLMDSTTKLELGPGEAWDLDCRMRLKADKTGLPYGGVLVVEYAEHGTTSQWDESATKITGSVIGGKTSVPDPYSVQQSTYKAVAFDVNPILTTGNKQFDLHIKVDNGVTLGSTNNIKLTLLAKEGVFDNGEFITGFVENTQPGKGLVGETKLYISPLTNTCSATRATLGIDIAKWVNGLITRDALGASIMAWVNCNG